jgi:hypothetical protein
MPADFTEGGLAHLARETVADGLQDFVRAVVRRLDGEDDPRAARLRENWEAITTADPNEAEFCRAAGRLGVDPYRVDDWAPGLIDFLERGLGSNGDQPITIDLLEASAILTPGDAARVAETWKWVDQTRETHDLRKAPGNLELDRGVTDAEYPAKRGYRLAAVV